MATLRSPKSTCRERQLLYFFPYEIIVEILLRLPVKSLLRFRCVCKSWCSQFSHPDFIKKHLDLLTKEDSLEKWRMVLCNSYLSIKTCPLYSIYREFANAAKIEYPLEKAGYRVRIIGSCNGLVCFHGENEEHIVYLWNPATRESKEILPALSFGRKFCPIVTYGFGYNEFNDDYKVVQISLKAVRFKIYSLRTNSWKLTWDFCYQPVSNESGNFVNGALNWLMTRREGQVFFMVLVSFNLKEETFQETPLPSCGTGVVKWMLRVLGGCLCILCDKETCLDVWMIKEYGVAASWTKFVTIQYSGCLKSLPPPRSFCILKYGTILIYFGETLVLYNIEEKTCKFPVIYGAQYCYEADIYLESLVSPHAYERFISWKLIKE